MGKKILKYTTIFSAIAFLSNSDAGRDARIMLGPVSLSPSKVIEPIEDVYKDVKKIIKKKKKRKR